MRKVAVIMRDNLIHLRKKKKLTQADTAKAIHMTLRQYSRLEAGTSDGSIKTWKALKELFADDFKESELKGRNAGRTEGAASKIIEKVIKKHQKGYTAEDTADMLEEPVSRIRQIYDVREKSSPDYDAETIYKQLCEKEE